MDKDQSALLEAKNIKSWEGTISIKALIVKSGYAIVSPDQVVIRKSQNPDSQVIHQFKKSDLVRFTLPRDSFTDMMLGYSGFGIEYKSGETSKKFNFWARGGMPAYPHKEENPKLGTALANFSGQENVDMEAVIKSTSNGAIYGVLLISFIVGFLFGGFIGALLLIAAGYLSFKVKEMDLNQYLKYLIYMGVYGAALTILLTIQLIILALLQ